MMRFFEEADDKYYRCKPCGSAKNQLISRSGSTSNLKRHMLRVHNDIFRNLETKGTFKRDPKPPKSVRSQPEKSSRSRLKNRFFEDQDELYWRCIPCGNANKLIARSGNTSNLKRHLQNAHPKLFRQFQEDEILAGNTPRPARTKKVGNQEHQYTCRACLTIDPQKTFQSLLEEPMRSTFWECTAIEIVDEDDVPQVLCSLCVARCEAAKHFRDMVHDNDDKLRENQQTVVDDDLNALDDSTMEMDTPATDSGKPIKRRTSTDDEMDEESEEVIMNEVFIVDYEEENENQAEIALSEDNVHEEIKQRRIAVIHQTKPLTCEFCEEELLNRTSCANHYQSEHPNEVYTCHECSKSFISAQTWRKHACPLTSTRYGCDVCPEVFYRREKLMKHMDEHMGTVKKYPCPICGHEFKQKGNMETHKLRHSDDKPFSCSECLKNFKTNRDLMRHLQLVHSNVRPFVCEVCSREFAFKFMLVRHMRTHTGEKKHYSCKEENCNDKLYSLKSLNHHLQTKHNKPKDAS